MNKLSFVLELLPTDGKLLFATRIVRLFAYGFLSIILVLYLAQLGLKETEIGILLTLTLVGDTLISLWITTNADRIGRRKMLVVGAVLMVFAGGLFSLTHHLVLLIIAATIGVISPSGNEIGPFLSIEQAALSQITPNERRTQIFSWYNLFGSFTTAIGSLFGGWMVQALEKTGLTSLGSYRTLVVLYAVMGLVLGILFTRLSPTIEPPRTARGPGAPPRPGTLLGLHRSRKVVFKLSALFSMDAFAGGFVLQSMVAYWFHLRFNVQPATLGSIFFGANILAGISALAAARMASKFGLINTMVFTHIPSNILLMLVPLMPSLPLAITVLLLRFSISQMDVPTRQSYTMAVVSPDERSAAAGITGIARTTGASLSPVIAGSLLGNPALLSIPFFLSGGIKILYDLMLFRSFKSIKPPEEEGKSH